MSTRPRTPEQFPRMRARGGRRRAGARSSQLVTSIVRAEGGPRLTPRSAVELIVERFTVWADGVARALTRTPRREDYALAGEEEAPS